MTRTKKISITLTALMLAILTYGILSAGRVLCARNGMGAVNFEALKRQCQAAYSQETMLLGAFAMGALAGIFLFFLFTFLEKRRHEKSQRQTNV